MQYLTQNFQELEVALNATLEDNQAYNILTTDPDLLADYVNDFFGPEGPAPVELPEDRLRAEVGMHDAGMAQRMAGVGVQYQRPQMAMTPPTGAQPQGEASDYWQRFEYVSKYEPQNLWRLLAQAPSGAFQQKVLVSEDAPF